MNITVECMGASMRWCGAGKLVLEMPAGETVAGVMRELSARYPELAARRISVAVAIGDEIVLPGREVREGEMLALIPPVSGG